MARWLDRMVRERWWFAVAVVVAVVLALAVFGPLISAILLTGYALVNCAGVEMYTNGRGRMRPQLSRAFQIAAAVLLPVGMAIALSGKSSLTPSQLSTAGSPDERVRNASGGAPAITSRGGAASP